MSKNTLKRGMVSLGVAAMATLLCTTGPTLAADNDRVAALGVPDRDLRAEYTFGIVPQQSASRLAQMWAPLLDRLSSELGVTLRFETAKDIPTFEACLAAGAYDFAYMNPVHYTIFEHVSGYQAIARQSDKRLRGLIVVHKDSPIQSLEELQGAGVAFPSPGAFGASVVPRAEMTERGIDLSPTYVKSHDSVYRAVVAGIIPAGGGVLRTFNAIDPALRDQLKIIYRTQEYTPHAIAARPDVSPELLATVRSTLVRMNTEAPELAASVGMNGFEIAFDEDWDDVRSLELGSGETGIKTEGGATCPSG